MWVIHLYCNLFALFMPNFRFPPPNAKSKLKSKKVSVFDFSWSIYSKLVALDSNIWQDAAYITGVSFRKVMRWRVHVVTFQLFHSPWVGTRLAGYLTKDVELFLKASLVGICWISLLDACMRSGVSILMNSHN